MGSRKYKVSSVLALLFLVLFGGSAFLNYKLATYDITVYNDKKEVVALCDGMAYIKTANTKIR